MKKEIESIKNIRKSVRDLASELSIKQLNKVPDGFKNNIIWNMAHPIAVQQKIFYMNSGLNPVAESSFCETYNPGTKPERDLNEKEIENIKELMLTTLDQFDSDYQNKSFDNFAHIELPFSVTLDHVDEALPFWSFHEGAHYGYILALKHLVG